MEIDSNKNQVVDNKHYAGELAEQFTENGTTFNAYYTGYNLVIDGQLQPVISLSYTEHFQIITNDGQEGLPDWYPDDSQQVQLDTDRAFGGIKWMPDVVDSGTGDGPKGDEDSTNFGEMLNELYFDSGSTYNYDSFNWTPEDSIAPMNYSMAMTNVDYATQSGDIEVNLTCTLADLNNVMS